ncbi:putative spermidine/putrescine transport system ATP-binding protein [Sporobacter termitidis DSM 10068]|uniref:ABC-type quaternary amine transporter n=1 Tax=Sporobacter termitidis DSM 10068 TaxID=1123282 RepID=A0A1M5XS71_9FIRM|nr:ABC transporter ATP-binding protein [Sporobacter termitidis]SHI02123.1 putative spermidine/putrescine transport system ATP-binding protein [Sporobacter termitidis DSM 10068]
MAYIQFEKINKRFGANHVLRDISLTIEKGQLVTLLGPSGCGKSTLLRTLAGLEAPDSGRVILDGEDITGKDPRRRNVGMIFQQYSLFPNMTVRENIAFGLKMQKKLPAEEINERIARVIDMVELHGKEKSLPAQLSGGQQQRVALARSIITEPKVLLFDEPLSAIDAKLRKALQLRIKEIQRSLGITAIFVTHDQDEAMLMSDVIHLFSTGKIEQSGRPIDMYTAPRTRFAAGFIGHYNILSPAQFEAVTGENRGCDVAIRPETVEVQPQPFPERQDAYRSAAVVEDFTPHGNILRYTLSVGSVNLQADVLFRSVLLFEPGQTVYLSVEKKNCLSIA